MTQLARVGLEIDPELPVSDLNFANRQLVELARVWMLVELSDQKPIIILDEPTTVLRGPEVERLFAQLRQFREQATIVFVSHHLEEVLELTDRIYVFKDGQCVGNLETAATTKAQLHQLMVGRAVQDEFFQQSQRKPFGDEVVLALQNLTAAGQFSDVTLTVHQGEIAGVAGVLGSGREALVRAMFGVQPVDSGTIVMNGEPLKLTSPEEAIAAGIGYVPQDRGSEGLIVYFDVAKNITLPTIAAGMSDAQEGDVGESDAVGNTGAAAGGPNRLATMLGNLFLDGRGEQEVAQQWVEQLQIKTPSVRTLVRNLSGGNQQKVVLSKWLASEVKLLILDHPTRGIDVGAKEEVYGVMRELAQRGIAIIMLAETLEETIGLSHTIYTMRDGQITHQFDTATETDLQPVDLINHMM